MSAIEKAVTERVEQDMGHHDYSTAAIITAYLDAILADPEAIDRIVKKSGLNATFVIRALKQEVER